MVKPDQLRTLADVADKYKVAELKITSAARIALIGLEEAQVEEIWKDLGRITSYNVCYTKLLRNSFRENLY